MSSTMRCRSGLTVLVSLMESSILSEVDDTSILRTGLPTPLWPSSQLATGLSPVAPRSGLERSDFVPCAIGVRPASSLGDKGDCVDLDAGPQQQAGDLDGGRGGRIIREDLAANPGEFGVGRKVGQVDLDADDLVHVGIELAQGLADAIEGDAHFLFKADRLVVRRNRHADLTRDEDPAAGVGVDTQRLAEALGDRTSQMSHSAH